MKSKAIKSKSSPFDEIPSVIVLDILSRLRTKSCLNCKLVCREWYDIIMSNEFANLHSARRCYSTVVLDGKFYGNRFDFLLLDLDESTKVDGDGNLTVSDNAMIRFKSNFYIHQHNLQLVNNEYNGLICLMSFRRDWDPYLVFNLLTGEQVFVEQQQRKRSCSTNVYGLGYCPVSLQYKVVRILQIKHKHEIVRCVAEIQTVGTNEWRNIGDSPLRCGFQYYGPPNVSLHGLLHQYCKERQCIQAFNFSNEQFSLVPTPGGTMSIGTILSVFDCCLCLTNERHNQWEMWLMKEYGVQASWVKHFVIQQLQHPFSQPMPLLQMEDTGKILLAARRQLHSYVGACDDEKIKWVKIRGRSEFESLMPFNTKFSKIT